MPTPAAYTRNMGRRQKWRLGAESLADQTTDRVHAYDRDDVALQFLLHDLHGPALRALEEQLIADAELQTRVAAIESELVHDYVAERLPADIRVRFEAVYLTHAERARKVEFARRLQGGLGAQ